jgi:hypothetical protein
VAARRVAALAARKPGQQTPYLAITGTARIVEGGAPELLKKTRQGDAGLRRTLPAAECARGAAHARPHRESGRLRPLDVLTPMRL